MVTRKIATLVHFQTVQILNFVDQSCMCEVSPTCDNEFLQILFWAKIQAAVNNCPGTLRGTLNLKIFGLVHLLLEHH